MCLRSVHSLCRAPFDMILKGRSGALITCLCLQIVQKQWIGEDGVRSVTQYHDVMGAILGKFAKGIVMVRLCQPRPLEYRITWGQLPTSEIESGDLSREA